MTTVVLDIAHLVQMSVAPVFLLTGVGAILSVLTTRLSRVIDRGRQIDLWIAEGHDLNVYVFELSKLAQRNTLINSAITLATLAAFLVCAVILCIFTSQLFPDRTVLSDSLSVLFMAAMLCLMIALLLFLCEVWVANTIRYFGHALRRK